MSKVKGELAEMIFQVEATKRDIIVAKPFGDNQTYDFVCDGGIHLYKIQVKSTSCIASDKSYYRVSVYKGGKKEKYCSNDFDFLAVYVEPENHFYIIPYEEAGTNIQIHPEGGYTAKYKEAWEQLK